MKPRHQSQFSLAARSLSLLGKCGVTFTLFTAAHAADVNTTGGTTVLNFDNSGNRYLGNGILQISADANSVIEFGNAFNTPFTELAMTSGGLISIDSGVRLLNGGFARGLWTNNLADMTINGTGSLDIWDGNPVRVDALNGTGSIVLGFGGANKELRVGVDNGSGTFSGNIAQSNGAFVLRLFKEGSGTQTFNGNLTAQIPRQYIINNGAVELSSAAAHSMTSQFLGSGNLTKSGAGALTISSTLGALMVSGTTNVTGGSLTFGSEVSARANLVAAAGTTLGLNFTGQATVSTLSLGGSGPLAAGIYDSTHTTYGFFFNGTGQLNVLNGLVPTGSGTWSSTTGGFWNVASRWTSGAIANGSGNTATISAVSSVAVTLDRDETLSHLSFQSANHTLNGINILTLAGTVPSVTVATGTSSRIETQIAGSAGLAKNGAGTLTLAGGNKTYTGGTAVNEGRLILTDLVTGTSNYSIESGATLELNYGGGNNTVRTLSNGTISGGGNLVKTGNAPLYLGANGNRLNINLSSGALIDVQAGLMRSEFGNSSNTINGWANNKADLNVAAGAFFDVWDSNTIVDAISGAGTINKAWNGTTSLTFGVDNGTGSFTGTISSVQSPPGGGYSGNVNTRTLNLIKNGTGTQTLSGNVSPAGTVTVNAGTLQLARTVSLYGGVDTSWTAANINVKSAASLALNVDSAGTNGFSAANLSALLANISVAGSATAGLQSGAILGLDTSTATDGTFTQGNLIANSTGNNGGTIGLTKLGAGTLVLDKNNTYTGTTAVNAGTLVINGNQSAANGAVSVSNAGTRLIGTGTIGGNTTVNAGAIHSAGSVSGGVGSQVFSNNLTYQSGSIFDWDIDTTTNTNDGVSVGGVLSVDSGAIFKIVSNTAFTDGFWDTTRNWNVFGGKDFDAFTLNFFANNVSQVAGDFAAEGAFSFTDSGTKLTWTAVPEPTTALAGLLLTAGLLRRRRA